ncbi:MAG: glycerol-3-phosphate 1-O-acyltransferase PlsY [Gaiellaceae bacterium]
MAVGYLAGSIPSGYWLVRLFKHEDIRKHGSGNIGASNVWRTYGRWYGVPVVLLDTAKGFVPALVFSLTVSPLAGVLAGAGAMLGHARPLFLRFERGGKMVATTGGAFLGIAPLVAAVGAVVWLVVFLVFRYASLASIAGAVSLPIAAVLLGSSWAVTMFAAFAAAAVVFLHRANVKRLLRGEENRFTLLRRKTGRERRTRRPDVRTP